MDYYHQKGALQIKLLVLLGIGFVTAVTPHASASIVISVPAAGGAVVVGTL